MVDMSRTAAAALLLGVLAYLGEQWRPVHANGTFDVQESHVAVTWLACVHGTCTR